MLIDKVRYRIINRTLYIDFKMKNMTFNRLNSWETVCQLPFSLNEYYDFKIANNDYYCELVDIRIYEDGTIKAGTAIRGEVTLTGCVSIPL